MTCLDCDSPYHARCGGSQPTAGKPRFGCTEPRCDGETHYTGERDALTNEDLEAGPCPDAGT